jgi:hypothetical protein
MTTDNEHSPATEDRDEFDIEDYRARERELMTFREGLWSQWERHGIGPDDESVRSAAAVGLVELAWRNSPVENMHASERGPSEGEMFAESVALQRHAMTALEPFTVRYYSGRTKVTLDDRRIDAFRAHLLDTSRPWAAGGRTLREMGYGNIGAFRDHVKLQVNWLLRLDYEYGYRAVLGLLIGKTGGGCGGFGGDHYGMPRWPAMAAAVREVLTNPDHPRWKAYVRREDIAAAPPGTPPPDELEATLLDGPDKLPLATLDWLVYDGIMFAAKVAEGEARRPAPGCDCSWCIQRQAHDAHVAVLDEMRAHLPAPGTEIIAAEKYGEPAQRTLTVISALPGCDSDPVQLRVHGQDGAQAYVAHWGDQGDGQWHLGCSWTGDDGEPCPGIRNGSTDRCFKHQNTSNDA